MTKQTSAEYLEKALNDALDLLTESLPYVEEGEQFNKVIYREALSKKIRKAIGMGE